MPFWKKDGDISDRLFEMAAYAKANPERFGKFAMVYLETLPSNNIKIRTMSYGCDTVQVIGLLEIGKLEINADSNA